MTQNLPTVNTDIAGYEFSSADKNSSEITLCQLSHWPWVTQNNPVSQHLFQYMTQVLLGDGLQVCRAYKGSSEKNNSEVS